MRKISIKKVLESEKKQELLRSKHVKYPVKRKPRKLRLGRLQKVVVKKTGKHGKESNPVRYYYLYALLLEEDHYYVGMTAQKDAVGRYQQHLDGKGSKWTTLHKPVQLLEVRPIGLMAQNQACYREDLMTIEYIERYTMDKVRGGKMCMVDLSKIEVTLAKRKTVAPVKTRKQSSADRYQDSLAAELSWIQ